MTAKPLPSLFSRLTQLFAASSLALGLMGCASQPADQASCEKTDWYEIGRRDGAQGATSEAFSQRQKACGPTFRADWETVYTNGRNAGLVEYCEAKNGYELGRMGVTYYYVCPSTVEPRFLASYRKGQQARDLELESKRLDLQIDQLAQKLLVTNDKYDQVQISSEIDQLKKTRAKKEKELSKIISK